MSWTESDGVTPHLFAALSRKTKVSDSCPCFIPPTVVLDHGVAVAYYRSGRLTTAHTPPSSDDDVSPTRAGSGTPSPTRPHASSVPRSTQRRLTRPIPGPVTVAPKRATRRRAAGTVEDGVRKNIGVKRVGGKQLSLRDLYEEWVPYTDDRSSAHHVVAAFVEFPPAGSRADGATPPVIVRGLTIDTLHDLLFHTTLRPRGLLQKVDEPVGVYYATITATWSPLVTVCDATRCPFEVKDRLRTATERIMSAECAGGVPFGLSRNVTDATRRICGSVAAHLALTEAAKVQGMQLHFTVTKRGRIQLLYSTSLRMVPLRTSLYTANPINTTLVFRSHDDYVKEQELKAHKALFGGDHRQPTVAVEISSPSPRHGGAIVLEDDAVGSPLPQLRVASPRAAGSASPVPEGMSPSMSPSHGRGSKIAGGGAGSLRARRRRTEQVPVSEWRDDQHQHYMREQARLTARHGHLFDRVPATGVDTDAPAVMNHLSPHLLARVMAGPVGQRLKSKPSPSPHLPALKDAPPSAHADPTPRLLADGVSKSLGFGRQTPDMLGRLGVSMLAESALPTRSHSVPPLPTRGTLPDGATKHTPFVSVHDSTPPMSKAQSTVTLRTVAETHIGVDITPPSLTPTNSVVASSRIGQNRRHPPRSVLVEPSAGTPSAVWAKAPNGRGRWMPRSVKRATSVTTKVSLQQSDGPSSQPPPVVAQVDASAVATDPDSILHGAEEQNEAKDSGRDQSSVAMAQMPSHGSIENDHQSEENADAPAPDTMAEQGTATLTPETSTVQREREAASNDLARAIADALVAPHNGSGSDNDDADAHAGDREGSPPGDTSPDKLAVPANQEEDTAARSTDEPAAQHEHDEHSTGENTAPDADSSAAAASKTQDESSPAQEPSAVPVAAVAPVRYNGAAFNALFGGCRVRSTLLQGVVDLSPAHTTRPSPSKGVKGAKTTKNVNPEALSTSPPKAGHDAKAWGYGARGLDPSRKRFLSERSRRQAEREKSAAALTPRDGEGSDSDTPAPGDHQGGPARHTEGSSAMVQAVSPSQLLGLSTLSTHKPRPASTDSSASTRSLASTHRSLPTATAQPTAQQYLAGPPLPVPEVELVVEIPQPVMDAFADAAYTVEAQVMVLPSSAPFVYVLGLRGAAVDYAEALHGVLAAFHPEVISHDGIDPSDFPGLNFDGCTESPPPTSAPPAHPHDAYDQEFQDDLDVPHVLPDTHTLLASVSQAEAETSVSDQGTHDPSHDPARGVDGQRDGRRGSDALSWTYTTPRSESTLNTASRKASLGPTSEPSTGGVTATASDTVEGGSPRVPRKASHSHSDVDGTVRDRSARRSLVDFVSSSPTSPPQGSTTNDTAHGSVGTHVSIRLPHSSGHDLHDSLVKPRPLGVSGASAKKDLRRQSKEDATPKMLVPVGSFRASARLHGQHEPKLNAQASFTSSVSAPSLSKTCGSAMSAFFFFERGAGGAFLSARAGQGKKRKSYKVPLPTEPSAWFEADAPETAAPPSPGGLDGLDALYTQELEERSGCSVVLRLTATPLEVPGAVAQLHTKLHVLTTQQRQMRTRGN